MSYDVKYIGMDVHKEAIVIAVLNEGGKLVMESVSETKASSILQFLHGLRGDERNGDVRSTICKATRYSNNASDAY